MKREADADAHHAKTLKKDGPFCIKFPIDLFLFMNKRKKVGNTKIFWKLKKDKDQNYDAN